MVSKIFLGVGVVTALLFAAISLQVGKQVERALHRSSEESAVQISAMVRSSIEQAMLSGNGIKVKRLVEELKQSVSEGDTEIRIYDPQGIEVFAAKAPVPSAAAMDPQVAKVLAGQPRELLDKQVFRAIPMEPRCAREGCHDISDPVRGVLAMRVAEEQCATQRTNVVPKIIESGFIHLMSARRADHLDQFFSDISEVTPSIMAVAVYDNEGDPSFGHDFEDLGIDSEIVLQAMQTGKDSRHPMPGGSIEIVPLAKQERCVECHSQEEEMRGALLVALREEANPQCDALELETLIDTSLRHIMTSELGRMIALFLDSIAATDAVTELVLYDNKGRVYWNTTHAAPPPHISEALDRGESVINLIGTGEDQRLRVVEPLKNTERCARCHGPESPYRGLVEVSLSTRMAATTRNESRGIVMMTTALAALAMLFLLIAFLQYLVVRPVREISMAAASIGDGNLDVEVGHADRNGDEVARLGARINSMIMDLRTKFNLEKFVSKGAAAAAARSGDSVTSQGGKRTQATVLFSDIRGFTAYSEKVSAETVVAMLNRLLKAQTDVVHRFDGDVDKFVGDELMATFQGEDACLRATQCALEMVAAVHQVRETQLSIGIGISAGEVVLGAIGHENRLDFTVIGDVVNIGARLCAAADPDCIVVTAAVQDAASESQSCRFEAMDPIEVKGKAEPLATFSVHPRRG